ncbi:hypothetical protein QJS10_CPA01g01936 [Acorus calamus]|uniref:Uncharacterized protein n=1 Tax=Acorus calamus TaxID=4465 RepID=A0AAV9FI53_ACOCL|nr:hypothetical protein QJS10_CPA01g01936 [Acorus calamus]
MGASLVLVRQRTINQLDTSASIEVTNHDEYQSPMHQFGFGDDDIYGRAFTQASRAK